MSINRSSSDLCALAQSGVKNEHRSASCNTLQRASESQLFAQNVQSTEVAQQ